MVTVVETRSFTNPANILPEAQISRESICAAPENPLLKEGVVYTVFDSQVKESINLWKTHFLTELFMNRRMKYVSWANRFTGGNLAEAEDHVSEGFTRALSSIGNFNAITKTDDQFIERMEDWLYRIMKNKIISDARHINVEKRIFGNYSNDELAVNNVVDPGSDFEQRIIRSNVFADALNGLPETQRTAAILEGQDYNVEESAVILNKTNQSVKLLRFRARHALSENTGLQDLRLA